MTNEPIQPDNSMMVQLTRMEGILNNVNEKVGDLKGRVDRHEQDINMLKADTQQLRSDAVAKDLTVIATAKALSEAKEAADAAGRAEVAQSERRWSPFARTMTVVATGAAFCAALATLYITFHR
jgi:TolA-binding protein